MLLKGKTAIVTGGARGIGKEIALTLAKEGASVCVCDVNDQGLEDTAKELSSLGVGALGLKVDVTDFSQVQNMVQKVLDKFSKIDILINNAGITRDNLLLRMKEDEWDTVLNVNLKGTFNCTKAASKAMIKQRAGKIVSIASIIGLTGNAGQSNYAASKGGMISFTKSVAKELACRNINVNAIAPGFIQTDMTAKLPQDLREEMLKLIPLNRLGEASDVANLALFLVSENSRYITGHVIQVDGGMVM
ncbi:MAG: 3-oxoacyl-[acyl-carrier-protein] reductase [Candidatus Omnitrophica bacterium]|nr:3-oxoacyl-[acyl-carrier-protein] reductase [Candidatus Omnitrophota bacterium]